MVQFLGSIIIHIVVSLIKNENDREDISQDVFLKVYEKLHTFQFRSRLSTWIGNIAYNTSINFLQKKKTVLLDDIFGFEGDASPAKYEDFIRDDKTENPERILIQKEEIRILEAAVNRLPMIQKTLLLLFHRDELSLGEIGLIIECL